MPRLGTESSSSRRHNPTQTLSDYFHITSQVWSLRSDDTRADPSSASSSHASSSGSRLDVLDDLLSRVHAPEPRTRWNTRRSLGPYGQRPLHKWLPSEHRHFEEMDMLMETFPEPNSDDEEPEEKELHEILQKHNAQAKEKQEGEEDGGEDAAQVESEPSQGEGSIPPSPPQSRPLSPAATKRHEKNKKKKAKVRAKAKEKEKGEAEHPSSGPILDTPQDLLASMSRIAKLVGSLTTDAQGSEPDELLRRVRDALGKEGQPSTPAEWRSEVLQSVRRMESMLARMEKWQTQVAPGEIEALRQETVWLEMRVRSVVQQKEQGHNRKGAVMPHREQFADGKSKEREDVRSQDPGSVALRTVEDRIGMVSAALPAPDTKDLPTTGDDSDSLSDSGPDSNSCPSESDTGLTEPESGNRSPLDEKAAPPPPPFPAATSVPQPAVARVPVPQPPADAIAAELKPNDHIVALGPHGYIPPAAPAAGIRHTALNTLTSRNHNIPPDPPPDPIQDLTEYPWTMLEVLFLLEVIAHFPPAENGWTFIAEAYNNILITRPLQEWFEKQATMSREEEDMMKALLRKLHKEAYQLRAGPKANAGKNGKAGERGRAAPFGSAEARAEASAHAKASANPATPTAKTSKAPDSFVTMLPFSLQLPGGDAPTQGPEPLQRIFPFPRRRPPLTLPSEDASAFARVMKSAAAGVRPPSAESRAAMVALYTATETRFPVRTPWDCWHRWCTPWVAQEPTGSSGEDKAYRPAMPPMVLDYVAGNIGLPCGTWITQARQWVFKPVPGTYPDAPGVMHKVTAGYDPRPGMVAFARMTHLSAEKAWAAIGLGRKKDGTVSEEVLASRRMKLPSTLTGLWPGKPPQKPPNARAGTAAPPAPAPDPASASSTPTAPAPSAPAGNKPAQPASFTPPPPAAPSTPAKPQPQPAGQPQARPALLPNTGTISQPAEPFLPLPVPRGPPPNKPLNVPEGTLGNAVRPGIRAWFQVAAVRADVLERVTSLKSASDTFERAMGRPSLPVVTKNDPKNKARAKAEAEEERVRRWEKEREREKWVPVHLRNVVVPPPPPLCSTS
ncbi:hypothetical protein BD309DRAFT_1012196 [Dichomitus squalens]|uniref:Uncharacterized protein n=1 Tax=Dichomitus squalens TaxID=114155 RepID=A0A4Q9PJF7_9APHY|nr:hypothetical protein BD309DRAFT_1012196 [Dichomitus squalens]TBU54212.1 hypothetical protein BD310DRAFT_858950 [Dichomitus squalens]